MTDIDKTLRSVLFAGTGVKVYSIKKPLTADMPSIEYMRVSDIPQITQSGKGAMSRIRFQITCTATSYGGLRTLVASVETTLVANTTDWSVSIPLEGQFEDKDENASVYTSIRDYFIWFK